jgi:hypothetical protein
MIVKCEIDTSAANAAKAAAKAIFDAAAKVERTAVESKNQKDFPSMALAVSETVTAATESILASSAISIRGPWILKTSGITDNLLECRVSCIHPDGQIDAFSSLFGVKLSGKLKMNSDNSYSWVHLVHVLFIDGHREQYPVDQDGFAHGVMKYFRRSPNLRVSYYSFEFAHGRCCPIVYSEALKLLKPSACDDSLFCDYIRVLEIQLGADKLRSGVSQLMTLSSAHDSITLVDYYVTKVHDDGRVECKTKCLVDRQQDGERVRKKWIEQYIIVGHLCQYSPNGWFTWHGDVHMKEKTKRRFLDAKIEEGLEKQEARYNDAISKLRAQQYGEYLASTSPKELSKQRDELKARIHQLNAHLQSIQGECAAMMGLYNVKGSSSKKADQSKAQELLTPIREKEQEIKDVEAEIESCEQSLQALQALPSESPQVQAKRAEEAALRDHIKNMKSWMIQKEQEQGNSSGLDIIRDTLQSKEQKLADLQEEVLILSGADLGKINKLRKELQMLQNPTFLQQRSLLSHGNSVSDIDHVVLSNPFSKTQSMIDMPTLTLQNDFSKSFCQTKKGMRCIWGGYMHLHMDAFLVPAGFPEVPYLNSDASCIDQSDSNRALMFGRVRSRSGHIYGKNPSLYFADVILIIQPDNSCSFHRLDLQGMATGESMNLQASGALNPSSCLRKCPFPCTFLPGMLQPKYTARENWQCLECIAQCIVGTNWQVSAAFAALLL